jgi:hypothetical protein
MRCSIVLVPALAAFALAQPKVNDRDLGTALPLILQDLQDALRALGNLNVTVRLSGITHPVRKRLIDTDMLTFNATNRVSLT